MDTSRSVLIVDDEAHVRLYIKLILKELGFEEFYEAHNGQTAIEAYFNFHPSIVLMDINMPIMDGLTALAKIRERDPAATIVMLTTLASREKIERSMELGASQFIRKDNSVEEVTKLLRETLMEIEHEC